MMAVNIKKDSEKAVMNKLNSKYVGHQSSRNKRLANLSASKKKQRTRYSLMMMTKASSPRGHSTGR